MTNNFARACVFCVVTITTLFGVARPAFADNVDTLIGQLSDDSDKIRLSATLNLTKLGDPKAIPALIKRLDPNVESSKNVRGAAAKGLGALAARDDLGDR
jgi:HEAT repeat protein